MIHRLCITAVTYPSRLRHLCVHDVDKRWPSNPIFWLMECVKMLLVLSQCVFYILWSGTSSQLPNQIIRHQSIYCLSNQSIDFRRKTARRKVFPIVLMLVSFILIYYILNASSSGFFDHTAVRVNCIRKNILHSARLCNGRVAIIWLKDAVTSCPPDNVLLKRIGRPHT